MASRLGTLEAGQAAFESAPSGIASAIGICQIRAARRTLIRRRATLAEADARGARTEVSRERLKLGGLDAKT